jgi:hypothetical protein
MIHWLLSLALMMMQIPPDATGGRTRVERDHAMDESDADSLLSAARARSGLAVGVDAIAGLPVAPAEREAFLEGFRQAFLAREFPAERVARRGGAVTAAAPLRASVRLATGEDEEGAWASRLRLEWFTPADSTADSLARAWPGRAVRVAVVLTPPEDEAPRTSVAGGRGHAPGVDTGQPGGPAGSAPVALRFPVGHPVDAAYLHNAGRAVGLLLIEALAHARGELSEDRRLRIEDALRLAPADPARPAPAPGGKP